MDEEGRHNDDRPIQSTPEAFYITFLSIKVSVIEDYYAVVSILRLGDLGLFTIRGYRAI